jgi:ring-1,2-phenylacetyl-CoA epoxidase subunit PaaD
LGTPEAVTKVLATVTDPELPVLTLADLGVIREVEVGADAVTVTITPTYTGCPALAEMQADLRRALTDAGYRQVEVRTALSPPWSTDWITDAGRRKLAEAGIAPPARVTARSAGPVPLTLDPPPSVRCPRCGARETEQLSWFGPTPCTALRRCTVCQEPFEHVRAI